jgi:hypothetical protein
MSTYSGKTAARSEMIRLNSLDANDYNRIERIYLEYHDGLQNLPETLERNGFNFHIIGNAKRMGYIVGRRGSGH